MICSNGIAMYSCHWHTHTREHKPYAYYHVLSFNHVGFIQQLLGALDLHPIHFSPDSFSSWLVSNGMRAACRCGREHFSRVLYLFVSQLDLFRTYCFRVASNCFQQLYLSLCTLYPSPWSFAFAAVWLWHVITRETKKHKRWNAFIVHSSRETSQFRCLF